MSVCLLSVVWLEVSKWVYKVLRSSGRIYVELIVLAVVL